MRKDSFRGMRERGPFEFEGGHRFKKAWSIRREEVENEKKRISTEI